MDGGARNVTARNNVVWWILTSLFGNFASVGVRYAANAIDLSRDLQQVGDEAPEK